MGDANTPEELADLVENWGVGGVLFRPAPTDEVREESPACWTTRWPGCWLLKVKAVTYRRNPIMQTCIGPSGEHVNMAGIPTEASILGMIDKALPGKVVNCYAHRSGGGKYMAVLQCRKTVHTDEGKQRQAALLACLTCWTGIRRCISCSPGTAATTSRHKAERQPMRRPAL